MRNIWAVQRPTPLTLDRAAMSASSSSRDSPRGVSTTVPSRILADRSRSDAVLLADRPTARRVSSESVSRPPGFDVAVKGSDQPAVYGGGRPPGQLLVDDGLDQRSKVGLLQPPQTR